MKLFVRAVPEAGFYRAGMHFPQGGVEVDVDEKTAKILRAERKLVVSEPEKKSDGKSDRGK